MSLNSAEGIQWGFFYWTSEGTALQNHRRRPRFKDFSSGVFGFVFVLSFSRQKREELAQRVAEERTRREEELRRLEAEQAREKEEQLRRQTEERALRDREEAERAQRQVRLHPAPPLPSPALRVRIPQGDAPAGQRRVRTGLPVLPLPHLLHPPPRPHLWAPPGRSGQPASLSEADADLLFSERRRSSRS